MDKFMDRIHDVLNENSYDRRNRSEQDFLVLTLGPSGIFHFIWGHSLCHDSFQLIKDLYEGCDPPAQRYHLELNNYTCHYLVCRSEYTSLLEKLHVYGVKPAEYIHLKTEIHKSKEIGFIFDRLFPESRNSIWK